MKGVLAFEFSHEPIIPGQFSHMVRLPIEKDGSESFGKSEKCKGKCDA